MEPIEKKSLAFLVELGRVVRNMQMYNGEHPIVKQGINKVNGMLTSILSTIPALTFGKGEGVLLIQKKQITEKNAIADKFVQLMGERNIGGVIIRKGVPTSELQAFIELMSTKPDTVVHDGAIKPEMLRPFKKISVNEIKYLMVDDDEDLESLTEARQFFNSIFTEEFKDLKGTDALKHIGQVMQKIMPQMAEMNMEDADGEMWEFFEKTIQSFGGGDIKKTKSSLITAIKSMDPKVQKSLFGKPVRNAQDLQEVMKKFSNERKVDILQEEVEQGTKDIEKTLDALLKSKGDVVELAEALSKKFSGAEGDAQEKLNQIFGMLQQINIKEPIKIEKRGKVFVAETEEQYVKEYQDLFKQLRFDVEMFDSGKTLREKLVKDKDVPDLLVMDVKIPDVSGIEILSTLDMSRIRVPVILCTEMEAVKTSFEVQMHPKLKFISKKSFNIQEVLNATNEFCPAPEVNVEAAPVIKKEEMPEEMKAELKKAREIQRNLLPKDFPPMEGYEVYAFYKAYDAIGGDYYDVIPIDDNHVGFLVADVSGHGITGAMVMVMVRSAIKTWAYSTTSPRELLKLVNPSVSRDILPGFFCTVYYSVLNLSERKLFSSCAGHNPTMHFRAKTKDTVFTKKGGTPLGILSGPAFERTLIEEERQLERGDRLIFYTDGMVETMSPEEEEYGEDRFIEHLNKVAHHRSDVCVKHLLHGVLTHQKDAPQHDDLTLLTLKVL